MESSGNTDCIETLKKSTMFHMSLGSKELFHSNFLHWISIVNWDAFLKIMHGLADVEEFWWEKSYLPQNNDVEVRRESRNFDLSIYIRIQSGASPKQQEDADEKGKKDVWIPIFVLENKMKSLPRHEQLQEYVRKAFNDWRRGKDKKQIEELWQEQPISFVLLSLYLPNDPKTLCECNNTFCYGSKNKKQTIELKCNWIAKNYGNLHDILNGQKLLKPNCLNQQIVDDYCRFIQALHEIAKSDWTVLPNNDFVNKIYPWAQKGYDGDKQTTLRIDDIRQKVHYAQLQDMLEKKLKAAGIDAKHVSEDKNSSVKFATSFAHNIGILEVSITFPKGKDSRIFIQLQGNSYCHAFYKEKGAAKQLEKLKDRLEPLMDFDENKNKTNKYPNSLNTNDLYPGGINTRAKNKLFKNFKYYGDNFIYQNVLIPQGVSVENVIDAMVEDTKKCLALYR